MKRKILIFILLLGMMLIPFFLQLGTRGLNEPDEGRYAEMGREMLFSGDWLVPRLNGVPHYAKPPWIYWCIATSLKFFGVNETAARLPSALAASVTVLLVFLMGRQMAGTLAGLLSSLVLGSSLLFFCAARLITADMMLTAWITLALFCFWNWWSSQKRWKGWLVGFYLALSIAFLDKGPVAIAVSFVTIGGFFLIGKQFSELKKLCWLRGLFLVAIISFPWFFWLCHLNPDLYDFYLVGEIKDRVIAGRGRVKVWYYFFIVLPLACWPWTALVVSAFQAHFNWWRRGELLSQTSRFLLSWIVFPFVLFTISSSKLPTYILPITVPISLLIGLWLAQKTARDDDSIPFWSNLFTWIFIPLISVALWIWTDRLHLSFLDSIWMRLLFGSIIFSVLVAWLTSYLSGRRRLLAYFMTWWLTAMMILQVILYFTPKFETEFGHNSSLRTLCSALDGKTLAGVPISLQLHPNGGGPEFNKSGVRVVMYEYYFRSSSFYLMKNQNQVVPLYGGSSLWELWRDINLEVKPTRDDLVKLLEGSEEIYVFSRLPSLIELRELTAMELPIIKTTGKGKHQVVLFTNKQL